MNESTPVNAQYMDDLHLLFTSMINHGAFTAAAAGRVVKGNARYGRELLGLLVNAGGLASEDEAGTRLDHWDTEQDAQGAFASAFNLAPAKPAKATKRVIITSAGKCACGCGKGVTSKVNFRPGHDARMVSQLVSLVVRGGTKSEPVAPTTFTKDEVAKITGQDDIQERIDNAAYLVQVHFSDALSGKFVNAAMSAWTKTTKTLREAPAKAEKKAAIPAGVVKVGRWTYPARKVNGELQRNAKTNGTGEWVAV